MCEGHKRAPDVQCLLYSERVLESIGTQFQYIQEGARGVGGAISMSLRICRRSLCGLLLTTITLNTDYCQWSVARTESSANTSIIYDRIVITKWLTGHGLYGHGVLMPKHFDQNKTPNSLTQQKSHVKICSLNSVYT